jgi:cyclopropane-fatty-acyl-phospholipid synthase
MNSSLAIPQTAGGIRRAVEARKARRRLLPVTLVDTSLSLAILGLCLASPFWQRGLLFYALGFVGWTLMEYQVHRYLLHGRFPDGPGPWQHFMHVSFDHLHWEHHARPWDGNHVNGTLKDTGLIVAFLLALSLLSPAFSASMLVAGLVQAYILEEWVHHSVHFCSFKSRYFRYIKRHHLYHHSPKGSEAGYGLTNGFWDVAFRTRFSPQIRRALHSRRPASRAAARPAA